MRIVQTDLSKQDLKHIFRTGILRYGTVAADSYVVEIIEKYELLVDAPQMNPERLEVWPPVRIHPYKGHLIVYRAVGDELQIIRVLGRYQNWQSEV